MKNSDTNKSAKLEAMLKGARAIESAIEKRHRLFMSFYCEPVRVPSSVTSGGSEESPAPIFDAFPALRDYDVPDDLLFDVLNWAIGEVVNGGFIPDTGETQSSDGV